MRNVTNMKSGIAVAGTILVDNLNEISAYPKAGELTQIKKVQKAVGGCVPNVAIDLKKINPDLTIKAVGKIGNDENGEFVKNTFTQNGVSVDFVKSCSDKTSFSEVMSVTGGERTFFTYPGASADFGKSDIDFDSLKVKMLHLGYFLLLDKIDNGDGLEILKLAKEKGIKTSIDLVSENSNRYSLVVPCLKYVDNLIINEVEAGAIVGIEANEDNLVLIAKKLKELGVIERVIIHTPSVSVCFSCDGETVMPSYDLPSGFIVGTTGAGDAFCAGALTAIYQEKTDKEILEFSSSTAVLALTKADAISGLKTQQEIIEFCKGLKRKCL